MTESHHHVRHQTAAVLDIGVGIGALVVHTSARLDGAEIHAVPCAPGGTRTHTEVHRRSVGSGGVAYAAVFPALAPGWYSLSTSGNPHAGLAQVSEGRVTELRGFSLES